MPTKCADEHAFAELKNDVICSGFTEVLVRSDNEPAILALEESAATALKLDRWSVKIEDSAHDSQRRVGRECSERCERCRENGFGLPRQTLGTGEVQDGHPDLTWIVSSPWRWWTSAARAPDGKTAYDRAKHPLRDSCESRKGSSI